MGDSGPFAPLQSKITGTDLKMILDYEVCGQESLEQVGQKHRETELHLYRPMFQSRTFAQYASGVGDAWKGIGFLLFPIIYSLVKRFPI